MARQLHTAVYTTTEIKKNEEKYASSHTENRTILFFQLYAYQLKHKQ